jgi:long-subunit fatty acid transport protein
MKNKLFLSVVFIFFSSHALFAGFFNQRNLLIGERAAMMGGAYTALADDNSAAYYNPAGLAFIGDISIDLSANVYNYQIASRESDTMGGEKVDDRTLKLIPTTFGISAPSGSTTLAFSIFQIDSFSFSGISINGDGSVSKWDMLMVNYLIGPSISFRINDSLSIGGSAFYHYFKGKLDWVNNRQDLGGDDAIQQNDIDSGGLTFLLGIKYKLLKTFSLGVNYGSETKNLHGKNNYTYKFGSSNVGKSDDAKGDQRLPHRIAAGIAYEVDKQFILTIDFYYYFKMKYDYPNALLKPSDPDFQYKELAHYDVSVGAEVFLNKEISLRFGFFTNTSGSPDESKTEKIDMYGGTFGVGYTEETVSSGFGVSVMYGKSDWQLGTIYDEQAKWERFSISLIAGGSKKF